MGFGPTVRGGKMSEESLEQIVEGFSNEKHYIFRRLKRDARTSYADAVLAVRDIPEEEAQRLCKEEADLDDLLS
jgi:hypothetical protein